VGAGTERLRFALAAHDVGAGAHAAGDDAQVAHAGANGALAGDEQILAKVMLNCHVIVMAIDRLLGQGERR